MRDAFKGLWETVAPVVHVLVVMAVVGAAVYLARCVADYPVVRLVAEHPNFLMLSACVLMLLATWDGVYVKGTSPWRMAVYLSAAFVCAAVAILGVR